MDAVHRKASEPAGGPRREDIVDTMVFKPSDVMLVHFRNVDFNYATKGIVPGWEVPSGAAEGSSITPSTTRFTTFFPEEDGWIFLLGSILRSKIKWNEFGVCCGSSYFPCFVFNSLLLLNY